MQNEAAATIADCHFSFTDPQMFPPAGAPVERSRT
jgi:hypothetical protein